jgi:hypothetical protein
MEIQLVELHFQKSPNVDYAAIRRRAEQILGVEIDAPSPTAAKEAYLLFHKNYVVTYTDGKVPAQTAILAAHEPIDLNSYAGDIEQSWACPNAESLLTGSNHTLLVTEMMARMLEPADRVHLFHGVLQAVVEETRPNGLVFKHSQQVIAPSEYLAATERPPINRPGSLNVRFFKISNSGGDMIMDTRGLHEIGLHDLQCHFRDLAPNEVSRVLFNTAFYIFENGPVIESGNTVTGVGDDSKWVCQFENALLEPEREVLDLNPGAPYAAGGRN